MTKMKKYKSVSEYLSDFDKSTQDKLRQLIKVFEDELPEAEQTYAYGIPTYKLDGKNVVHFAAFKNHISLFPGPKVVKEFKSKLVGYKTSKGTIQFPLDKPLPLDLIRKIVKFAKENNVR